MSNLNLFNFAALGSGNSTPAAKTFDILGDTDNSAFTDGERVTILLNVLGEGPAKTYQFTEAASDGDYSIQGPPSGYLNLVGSTGLLTQVLPVDFGVGTEVTANFSRVNQGGGENDLPADYDNYLVRRDDASLDAQTFDSGGVIIPADDFDWHWFRRVDDNTVKFLGKMFSGSAASQINDQSVSGWYDVGNVRTQFGIVTTGTASQRVDYPEPFGSIPSLTAQSVGGQSFNNIAVVTQTFGDPLLGFDGGIRDFASIAFITGEILSWRSVGVKP